MDITYNKVDETALPISTNRVSANEYNQIAGSLMHIINTSTLTPDAQDNTQLLNAIKALTKDFPYIVETYHNSTEWYRVWSDGWCEQGGFVEGTNNNKKVIAFLKQFVDTNYTVVFGSQYTSTATATPLVETSTKATTGFTMISSNTTTFSSYWEAKGYIS